MRLPLIKTCSIASCLLLLCSCSTEQPRQVVQAQVISLSVPDALLTPCALVGMEGDTVNDLVNYAIDQDATIACYKAKQDAVKLKVQKQGS